MKFSSRVVCVPRENIDTDQIIPARFLKVTDKVGIGEHLFEDRPDFRVGKGSDILVAGDNFGCGSSREHAVWALMDFGFNIPSLLSAHETAPYFYSGLAQSLEEVLNGSQDTFGGVRHHRVVDPSIQQDLIAFLRSIDATTTTFP